MNLLGNAGNSLNDKFNYSHYDAFLTLWYSPLTQETTHAKTENISSQNMLYLTRLPQDPDPGNISHSYISKMGSHKILPQGRALRSPKTEVVKWLEETFYYAAYNSYPRPPHIRPQTFSMGFSKQPPNHSFYIACYNTHYRKPSSIKTRPKIGLK